jgi:hypothetical protein
MARWGWIAWALAGCAPTLEDDTPYVDGPRLLAVQSRPAEAPAGEAVVVRGLFVDEAGEVADAPVDWAFCLTRKPLAELGPVAPSCLEPGADGLAPIGRGFEGGGAVPLDACARFGPNPPAPEEGAPGGRPVDPDGTGGYYQPVLGFPDGSDPVLGAVRLRCGLANVSQEVYVAWNQGYRSNVAPEIAQMRRGPEGPELAPDGAGDALRVSVGEPVALEVGWAACPDSDACGDGVCGVDELASVCPADCAQAVGCAGAERYKVYEPSTGALVTRREAISATWYSTGGALAEARNGVDGDVEGGEVGNTWTAPDVPGVHWLWVVLRDERGGVGWRGYEVEVGP